MLLRVRSILYAGTVPTCTEKDRHTKKIPCKILIYLLFPLTPSGYASTFPIVSGIPTAPTIQKNALLHLYIYFYITTRRVGATYSHLYGVYT